MFVSVFFIKNRFNLDQLFQICENSLCKQINKYVVEKSTQF